MGSGINATPRPLCPPVHIVWEVGRAPWPVRTGADKPVAVRIRSLDLPARNEKKHRLRYPSMKQNNIHFYSKTNQMPNISNLIYFGTKLYMFRKVSRSINRSLKLYIQHQVYVIQVLWLLAATEPV